MSHLILIQRALHAEMLKLKRTLAFRLVFAAPAPVVMPEAVVVWDLAAMTGRSIDRAFADRLLQVPVYLRCKRPHPARCLLGFPVIFFPLIRYMAMRAVHAERAAEADLHNSQDATCRHALQQLNILENLLGGFILTAGDLFLEGHG